MTNRFEVNYGDHFTYDDFDIGVRNVRRRDSDTGQPGSLGRCACVVGLALIVFVFFGQSLSPLAALGPAPTPAVDVFSDGRPRYSGAVTAAHASAPYGAWGNRPRERVYGSWTGPRWDEPLDVQERRSPVDPTLLALCVAVFFGCFLPQVMKPYVPDPPPQARPGLPPGPQPGPLLSKQNSISKLFARIGRRESALPSDAECESTYAQFGAELPQCVAALAAFVEHEVISPLVNELERSNYEWTQALSTIGWRLTFDVHAGQLSSMSELNVQQVDLPSQLLSHPGAAEKWQKRQQLEEFLRIPSCKQAHRQYVLGRLQEWKYVGLLRGMHRDYTGKDAATPTDLHILENLVLKMLQQTTRADFSSCFVSAAASQAIGPAGGVSRVAVLRQVTASPPHYEVVAAPRVWKLRHSKQSVNILEAVAVLMCELRKCPTSYQLIGPQIRRVMESAAPVSLRRATSF